MNNKKLLPCPFCGEAPNPHIIHDDYRSSCRIWCECGGIVEFATDRLSEEELERFVVDKWNKRVFPPEVQEAVDLHKPEKPVEDIVHLRCPNCGVMLNTYETCNCCNHCGQKIDWSDE